MGGVTEGSGTPVTDDSAVFRWVFLELFTFRNEPLVRSLLVFNVVMDVVGVETYGITVLLHLLEILLSLFAHFPLCERGQPPSGQRGRGCSV